MLLEQAALMPAPAAAPSLAGFAASDAERAEWKGSSLVGGARRATRCCRPASPVRRSAGATVGFTAGHASFSLPLQFLRLNIGTKSWARYSDRSIAGHG